jgi:ribosomal protein L35AE/L33A
MKLYRNIHHYVWQLLGVEKIQNGNRCHGNQGAKNVKFTPNFTNF